MKLIDNKGNLILERGKTKPKSKQSLPTLHIKSVHKTYRPAVLSREEFFKTIVNINENGNL